MKPKQFNSFPYLAGSLALVIVGIVFSAFLNSREPSQTGSVDLRTRASAPGLVKVTGIVREIHDVEGTIVVDDVRFLDATKTLGTWTVTPPLSFSPSSAFPGATLTITVNPPTMLAETHTLTATEITISR